MYDTKNRLYEWLFMQGGMEMMRGSLLFSLTVLFTIASSASAVLYVGDRLALGMIDDFESYANDAELSNNYMNGLSWVGTDGNESFSLDTVIDPGNKCMKITGTVNPTTGTENSVIVSAAAHAPNDDLGLGVNGITTSLVFELKGDASNASTLQMQMLMGGVSQDASGYVSIAGQYDLQSEQWQTVVVTPNTPQNWEIDLTDVVEKPGFWGFSFPVYDHSTGYPTSDVIFYIDNIRLVPEPATILLLAFGTLLLRKKRR